MRTNTQQLLLLLCLAASRCYDNDDDHKFDDHYERYAKGFFFRFGYYSGWTGNPTKEEVKQATKNLQNFVNLPATGQLDESIFKLMITPRCGLGDPWRRRDKNKYNTHGVKWNKKNLTWRLTGQTHTLDRNEIRKVLKKTFEHWSSVVNLNFTEVNKKEEVEEISIKFQTGKRICPYGFHGGVELAHAFHPPPKEQNGLYGDIHIDSSKNYTVSATKDSSKRIDLLWLVMHEVGHALGLDHSGIKDDVMYPWYRQRKHGVKLSRNDIAAIQSIYGQKIPSTKPSSSKHIETTTAKPTPTTTAIMTFKSKSPVVNCKYPCPLNQISAVYYNPYARLKVMLTKTNKLYFVNTNGGGIRYGPVPTRAYIPRQKIPNTVDAAFNMKMPNGREYTIFFADTNYYLYQHFRFRSGPHSIHGNSETNPLNLQFPMWVRRIDAAMTWHRDNQTYFFHDGYYWRYDTQDQKFAIGSQQHIQDKWTGLPKRIDAAYSSAIDRKTFFVSGDQCYHLNDNSIKGKPDPHHLIAQEWIQCSSQTSTKRRLINDEKWQM